LRRDTERAAIDRGGRPDYSRKIPFAIPLSGRRFGEPTTASRPQPLRHGGEGQQVVAVAEALEPEFPGIAVSVDQRVRSFAVERLAIVGKMPDAHRQFLISFKRRDPDWTLLGVLAAAGLPVVKWRQQNLAKLSAKKRAELVKALETVLSA
jgi:hypothetical protein